LAALRQELGEGLRRLPQLETGLAEVLHAHQALVAQFGASAQAPSDSIMLWLSSLSWPADLSVPMAVLTDLTSSGGLQFIESDSIRVGIAEYAGLLQRFEELADQAWATWAERLQPYLESRVSRVERMRQGRLAGTVPFAQSPFMPSYASLFADVAFESMIAERWLRLDLSRNRLGQLRGVMTEIQTLIDREMGAR
jgi:hypothetical protein